ncbi:MAG TPA: hypothetical protein VFV68_03215 [Agriterribacter sp.]|nr:hypothetical protein [Agriterribacter sp.]
MSVRDKHLATLLLGVAAAFGAYKYTSMTDEEKKKLADGIKAKFHKLKGEAESSAESAKTYFADLKDKAAQLLKEHFPDLEQQFEEFFKTDSKNETTAGNTPASQTGA